MTAYLKGDYLPKGENLGKMAAVLGVEVYDVMGMPWPLDREPPLIKWAAELLADPKLVTLYKTPDPKKRANLLHRLTNFERQISDEEARDLLE